MTRISSRILTTLVGPNAGLLRHPPLSGKSRRAPIRLESLEDRNPADGTGQTLAIAGIANPEGAAYVELRAEAPAAIKAVDSQTDVKLFLLSDEGQKDAGDFVDAKLQSRNHSEVISDSAEQGVSAWRDRRNPAIHRLSKSSTRLVADCRQLVIGKRERNDSCFAANTSEQQ